MVTIFKNSANTANIKYNNMFSLSFVILTSDI